LFAAGFIGTPNMNFLEFDAAEGRLRDGVLDLAAPFAIAPGKVTLGVRPGAVKLVSEGTPGAFTAVAERDEFHGETRLLALRSGGQSLLAAIPATVRIAEGERVWISLEDAALHLFDTGSGMRLSEPA